jgi:uncharacterized protein involved in exopolysaccharide biosynthesis
MQESLSLQPTDAQEQNEINVLDILIAIGEEKWVVFGFPLLTTLIALAIAFSMAPIFTAKTVMLPPQQQQSSAASALAGLGALGGLAGSSLGVKTPDELYSAFLKSDSIANALAQRFNLMERLKKKTLTDVRLALAGKVKISGDKKTGLITIEVDDKDPQFAADLANAYIDELHKLLAKLAVTDAQQRRVFLEGQLKQTKEKLALAEVRLRNMQAQSGVVSIDAQAQGAIKATVDLRAQIAQREVQLGALRTFATTENQDVKRLSAELAGLRAQLNRLESGSGRINGDDLKGLETVRAYREVKYQEAVMDALVKQFEIAKVDEAREGPLLQQVDIAYPPERKSRPKRLSMGLIGLLLGVVLGLLIVLFRRAYRSLGKGLVMSGRVLALKRAWSFGFNR